MYFCIMKEMLTPDTVLSDMIDINYGLLQVVSRIGLDLKYSGLKISEACARCGIDPETFLLVCKVYSSDEYVPTKADIASGNISDIIRYLHGSHLYYTGAVLAYLESSFDKLIAPCEERRRGVIRKFCTDYREELVKHFAYEEEVVFPYIESLLDGKPAGEYSINQFEEHHGNVEEKLEDMKNIVMKYLPAECDNSGKIAVLLSIYHLQDDLRRHTYVENDILVPMVMKLEKDGR